MSQSFVRTVGVFVGRRAADVVVGTRLGANQFSEGAKAGYADRAAELHARRKAAVLAAQAAPVVAPAAPARQRKVTVK